MLTAAQKPGHPAPYPDEIDPAGGVIHYHYRAGSIDQPDNRALRAAFELQAPMIYFLGLSPGQYQLLAPVFITADDPASRSVIIEVGLPYQDTQGEGIVSSEGARRERFSTVVRRLDQERFRRNVLRAYRERCAVCSLRESQHVDPVLSHSVVPIGTSSTPLDGPLPLGRLGRPFCRGFAEFSG